MTGWLNQSGEPAQHLFLVTKSISSASKQKRGVEMKTSTTFTWALAATAVLSCVACTKPSEVVREPEHRFSDYQLKKLVVLTRPHIYEASPELLSRALNIAPLMEQFIDPCTPGTTPVPDRVVKVRINQGFGQFEGRAGAEIARQRQMIDYIMRVSAQPPPQ